MQKGEVGGTRAKAGLGCLWDEGEPLRIGGGCEGKFVFGGIAAGVTAPTGHGLDGFQVELIEVDGGSVGGAALRGCRAGEENEGNEGEEFFHSVILPQILGATIDLIA